MSKDFSKFTNTEMVMWFDPATASNYEAELYERWIRLQQTLSKINTKARLIDQILGEMANTQIRQRLEDIINLSGEPTDG